MKPMLKPLPHLPTDILRRGWYPQETTREDKEVVAVIKVSYGWPPEWWVRLDFFMVKICILKMMPMLLVVCRIQALGYHLLWDLHFFRMQC